jgi:hypothetical protein
MTYNLVGDIEVGMKSAPEVEMVELERIPEWV